MNLFLFNESVFVRYCTWGEVEVEDISRWIFKYYMGTGQKKLYGHWSGMGPCKNPIQS